MEDNFNKH